MVKVGKGIVKGQVVIRLAEVKWHAVGVSRLSEMKIGATQTEGQLMMRKEI